MYPAKEFILCSIFWLNFFKAFFLEKKILLYVLVLFQLPFSWEVQLYVQFLFLIDWPACFLPTLLCFDSILLPFFSSGKCDFEKHVPWTTFALKRKVCWSGHWTDIDCPQFLLILSKLSKRPQLVFHSVCISIIYLLQSQAAQIPLNNECKKASLDNVPNLTVCTLKGS